jgi:hypothetical protein
MEYYLKIMEKYNRIEKQKRTLMWFSIRSENIETSRNRDKIEDSEQLNFDRLERRVNTVSGGSTGTVRNLRIREDTAKYLYDLDLDSAYYDPKSRSMREDPNALCALENKRYTGDNSYYL